MKSSVEYVWEWPVRITHWVNVIAILVLAITGIYMGYPFMEADSIELMWWMQFVHFLFGYVLAISLVSRIIWFFMGNQYADWRTLLPLTDNQRTNFWAALQYYLFLRKDFPKEMGHTYLAAAAYSIVLLLIAVQCLTGFALYFMDGGSSTLVWVFGLFGGVPMTLWIHHALTWIFAGFLIHHVYCATVIDIDEKNGVMSSIFTGYKTKR